MNGSVSFFSAGLLIQVMFLSEVVIKHLNVGVLVLQTV